MPDKEKVIAALERCMEAGCDGCPYDGKCAQRDFALNRDIIELLKEQRWISTKERLPEERINPLTQDFEEVICFCDFGGEPRRTDVRTYKFGKPTWDKDGHFLHGCEIMDGVITHWQYLPEPPEEVTGDALLGSVQKT